MIEERWCIIPDWNDYAISDMGRVKRLTSYKRAIAGTILSQFLVCGYPSVNLSRRDGKRTSVRVHRLMAAAFLDKPPEAKEVNHIDACRSNNQLSNLEWVTSSGNRFHAHRVGSLKAKGQDNGYSRLIDEAVYAIRASFESSVILAKRFNVSPATIKDVRSGRTWRHLMSGAA